MAINPLDLDIIEDCTISATVDVDAIVSGTLDLTVGFFDSFTKPSGDREHTDSYGKWFNSGDITNNTTGIDFNIIGVVDVWYEIGTDYTPETLVRISMINSSYEGCKLSVYDATTNALLFPETVITYYSQPYFNYYAEIIYTTESTTSTAGEDMCGLVALLMNNVGKTVSLKVVIK